MKKTPQPQKHTRYPIVLVHGIILKDIVFFKAFGRIEKTLKRQGYKVYTAKTDGFGTIENNAEQLKSHILKILELEHTDKVNLIAHSKGGLDSKYMINQLNFAEHVPPLIHPTFPSLTFATGSMCLNVPNPKVLVTTFTKFSGRFSSSIVT